jgi:hypothetical protein
MKINNEFSCSASRDELLRYLLVKSSPVMMKVKPAMLVRISNCFKVRAFQAYEIFCSHQQAILDVLDLDYMIMKNNGKDMQVLFYDSETLSSVLATDKAKDFLKIMGYATGFTTVEYLEELRSRFTSRDFPHEIGIFLGYPLKDVKGFINDYDSGFSVNQGRWRIFGDAGESLHTMSRYRFAENFGKRIIEHYQDISLCVAKIKSSVITQIV